MKQCLTCRGLVPESLDACPNCAIDRRPSLLKVAGLVALMTTGCPERNIPVPVYGAPPPPPPAAKAKQPEPPTPVAEEKADGGSP
jgi:hypothetical protein